MAQRQYRRRARSLLFDDLVAAPWPVGVVVGIAAFVALRYGPGLLAAASDAALGAAVWQGIEPAARMFAWLMLGACLLAALVSFGRHRRDKPAAAVVPPVSPTPPVWVNAGASRPRDDGFDAEASDATVADTAAPAPVTERNIANLSWLQFERLVAASFRRRGFEARLTPDGADEGVDIVLRERDNVLLVQCKHWVAYRVGVSVVRELYGVLHAKNARKAILVTSGRLTGDARRFCRDNAVHVIDETSLKAFIDPQAMPPQSAIAADRRSRCPLCGDIMIRRTARKSGRAFFGCRRFPACRGTRYAESQTAGDVDGR